MSQEIVGRHVIIDAWSCPTDLLDDPIYIRQAVIDATAAGRGTLLHIFVHHFSPQGDTVSASLAESHLSVHTWPQIGYFAADIFFCGKGNPERALESLQAALKPKRVRISRVKRGIDPATQPAIPRVDSPVPQRAS